MSVPDLAEFTVFAAPVIIYILGFVSGYLVSTWVGGLTKDDMQQRIALLVTLIWILSVTAGIILPDYDTAVWIHAIMGGVAGYLFSGEADLSVFPGSSAPSSPDPPPRRETPHETAHGVQRRDTDENTSETTNAHSGDENTPRHSSTEDPNT